MKSTLISSRTVFILAALLVAAAGCYFLMDAMHWGPWAFSDSSAYVSAARNFNAGRGFVILNSNGSTSPVTEFPPFHAIFLSFFLGENGDPNAIIPWLNLFLFAAFLLAVGFILHDTFRNNLLALAGMLFCLFSPILLEIFSGVMSETLFFPLLFIILLLTTRVLNRRNEALFILLTVLSCLLPITRYAGILFVGVITLMLLVFYPAPRREKWLHALGYALSSLLPVGVWFLRLYTSTAKVGGKSFSFDWTILSNFRGSLREEFQVLKTWLPYYGVYENPLIDQVLGIGAFLLLIALFVYWMVTFIPKYKENSAWAAIGRLFFLTVINLCAYLLFIALTHTVTVPQIDIINRMLAPILPLLVILVMGTLGLLGRHKPRVLLAAALLVLAVVLRFNFYQANSFVREMHEVGHGFSNREYRQSGLVEHIQAIPDDQRMVSNAAPFVLYYTNRFPIQVDQFANRTFGSTNGYGERWVREKGAALIILYPEFRNFYGKAAEPLLETVTQGLDVAYQDETGGIYYYPDSISD
ncbi:MAG: hypothetical protein PWQ55_2213 [Chloroflexota bacterium]|nr:hypothetical protein [Chloroflexota bacterium]